MSNILNKAQTNLVTIEDTLTSFKASKEEMIQKCITYIKREIVGNRELYNVNSRKAVKLTKEQILNSDTVKADKNILRAFKIALIMIQRDLVIAIEVLTISQIENLCLYGTKNGVNGLMRNEDYIQAVKDYLKELKTREVITKTFEKRGK